MRPTEFTIFSGTANPALARVIGHELGTRVGNCVLDRYPDGEVAVQILESVRRKEVFLMQPTSPPANDHLIELLALADASRRAGAARITAIVPYFGYGRADRRHGARGPTTSSPLIRIPRRSKVSSVLRWIASPPCRRFVVHCKAVCLQRSWSSRQTRDAWRWRPAMRSASAHRSWCSTSGG